MSNVVYLVHEELTHGPSGMLVTYWLANAPQALAVCRPGKPCDGCYKLGRCEAVQAPKALR